MRFDLAQGSYQAKITQCINHLNKIRTLCDRVKSLVENYYSIRNCSVYVYDSVTTITYDSTWKRIGRALVECKWATVFREA